MDEVCSSCACTRDECRAVLLKELLHTGQRYISIWNAGDKHPAFCSSFSLHLKPLTVLLEWQVMWLACISPFFYMSCGQKQSPFQNKIGQSQMHVFLLPILLKCVWDRFWSHTWVQKTYIICKLISLPCNSITYFSLVQTSLKDSPS